MATPNQAAQSSNYRLPAGGWQRAWVVAAAIGALGTAGALFGYTQDARRFAFSYLFAFISVLAIALGSAFFVVIQHLTAAGWSVSVRRIAELLAAGLPVFLILFLPLLLGLKQLYPWLECGHTPGAAHVGDEPASGHGGAKPAHPEGSATPAAAAHHSGSCETAAPAHHLTAAQEHHEAVILSRKTPFLNMGFFMGRAALYLLVWAWIGMALLRSSVRQDQDGDVAHTRRLQRFAPKAVVLLALTLTFAAFDWIMSLEPAWYSTIFGVQYFAGSIVSALALLVLLVLGLRAAGGYRSANGEAVTVEHMHDLGKLLFGFLVFWAYISFSQLLLIWYSGIPEEATYYHARWNADGWRCVSLLLVFGHFIVPFLFLLSRNIKRRLALLGFGAAWILVMHVVESYWLVMPYFDATAVNLGWLDIACLMATAGWYFAFSLRRLPRESLVPLRDPRLDRALHFVNA